MNSKNNLLRQLPSISALLETPSLRDACESFGHAMVADVARQAIDQLRAQVQQDPTIATLPNAEAIAAEITTSLQLAEQSSVRPVINATGILLHTGLGRAPLATVAALAASDAAKNYCNVELNLEDGQRTQRAQHAADLLCQLTGAEAAHVVNNNAGATALVLAALATNREVIISHGELIEIGGGYRMPDVIETFGARLRPVGTTNKTRPSDYEQAVDEQTGALLVVHPSNYQISGFTQTPPLGEIADIAQRHNVPFVHDIGSGALIDFAQFGCSAEPVASASIQAGADLVLFSGDKLLGGPQAGIIIGRRKWMEQIVKHPLNRALRVDKITLAALRATLELYRRPDEALASIPLLQFLQIPVEELKNRAESLADQLRQSLEGWQVDVTSDDAFIGGGSVPQQAISSWAVTIQSDDKNKDINALARQLRLGPNPVVARIQRDQLIFGLHGVFPEQDTRLMHAICQASQNLL